MNETQKDELLQMLLQTLATRGLAIKWASVKKPYSGLVEESCNLLSVNAHLEEFRIYLQSNPIIQDTVETLLSHLAMSANAKWQDTPAAVRSLAQRGWYLGRWLPTYLIIDGPLGRFLKDSNSPLVSILKKEYSKYPLLTQARHIFNNELFRLVRNGVIIGLSTGMSEKMVYISIWLIGKLENLRPESRSWKVKHCTWLLFQ